MEKGRGAVRLLSCAQALGQALLLDSYIKSSDSPVRLVLFLLFQLDEKMSRHREVRSLG